MDDARVTDLFTPLTRAASTDGIPGPDVAAYDARRAAGGTALVITEGGTISAQLWHQGAARGVHDDDGPDQVPVSPSGIDLAGGAVGRALLADPGWVNRMRDGMLDQFVGFDAASALGRLY